MKKLNHLKSVITNNNLGNSKVNSTNTKKLFNNQDFTINSVIYKPMMNNFTSNNNIWNGFHKKSIVERQHQLKSISQDIDLNLLNKGGLEIIRADSMVENCIGILSLPVGLGLHFKINSKNYSVPMAVEEPSIIAASSAIAKLIGNYGGFFSMSDEPIMTTQLHIIDCNSRETINLLKAKENEIISLGNNYCQKMVQRGGGVLGINFRELKSGNENGIIVLDILINVCESMGANLLNTVAEGVSIYIESIIKGKVLMKILSNLSVLRKTLTEFKIPVSSMEYKGISGKEVCYRIIKAYEVACLDVFRTTTHNKGVMNGIDAVALALGQDWRAIEAGCHAYASLKEKEENGIEKDMVENDQYKSLTYYKLIEIDGIEYLYGRLKIPLALGVVGGAIGSNPNYSNFYKILGQPSSKELASIMASVGLSNNLAALRALVCTGIQKGHMGLHARNIAIRVGTPENLISEVVEFMKNSGSITEDTSKEYLLSHNLFKDIRKETNRKQNLSNFFIEINYDFLKQPITMNIVIDTPDKMNPLTLTIQSNNIETKFDEKDKRNSELYMILFGSKSNEWLKTFLSLVNKLEITKNDSITSKLKFLLILFYTISYNLINHNLELSKTFIELLEKNMSASKYLNKENFTEIKDFNLLFGFHLISEILEIIKFYLDNYSQSHKYKEMLTDELKASLKSFIKSNELPKTKENFNEYFELRLNRINAKVILLTELCFSEHHLKQKLNTIEVNEFLNFGKYIEINATLIRDFYKRNVSENASKNSFNYFKKFYPEEKYFEILNEEKNILKKSFEKNEIFTEILAKFEKEFTDMYKYNSENLNNLKPKF